MSSSLIIWPSFLFDKPAFKTNEGGPNNCDGQGEEDHNCTHYHHYLHLVLNNQAHPTADRGTAARPQNNGGRGKLELKSDPFSSLNTDFCL